MVSSLRCIYLSGTSTPHPPRTRWTLSLEMKSRRRDSKGQGQSFPERYYCVLALVPCGLLMVCIGGFTRDFPQDLSHNPLNITDIPSTQQLLPTFSTLFLVGNSFQATFLSRVSLNLFQAIVHIGSIGNTHLFFLQTGRAGHSLSSHFSLLCHQSSQLATAVFWTLHFHRYLCHQCL